MRAPVMRDSAARCNGFLADDCALNSHALSVASRAMSFSPLGALPLLALAATPATKSTVGPDPRLAVAFVALILITLAWQIVSYFLASKILAPEKSEFVNALKLWGMMIFAGLGVFIVVGCGVAAESWLDSRLLAIGSVVMGGLMAIYIGFRLPMEIYGMGVLRTFVFHLLSGIIVGLGQFAGAFIITGADKTTPVAVAYRNFTGRQPGDQDELRALVRDTIPATASYLESADAAMAADRTKPVPERKAALRRMARRLEARRVALDVKDKAAVADYKRDAKRYGELFHEVNPPPPKP